MLLTIKGFQGIISPGAITRTEIQSDQTATPSAWNVEFWPRGTLSKRDGIVAKHADARATKVVKLYEWIDLSEVHHTMMFQARGSGASSATSAEVYAVTESTAGVASFTLIVTGGTFNWVCVSADDVIGCATYSGSAVFVNQGDGAPLTWNGNTSNGASSISGAPSGATCCVGWGGYLFLGNLLNGSVRAPSRVQWNSVNDIWTWPSNYYIDLDGDDGDHITSMILLGDQVVIFKENKIFTISWVGGTLMFDATRRSAEIGCIAGDSIVEKNGLIYFLSRYGVYTFDGQSAKCVSDKISDKVTTQLNQLVAKTSKSVVYHRHEQIWFAVPTLASSTLNVIYILDYVTGGWTAYSMEVEALSNLTLSTDQIYSAYPNSYSTYPELIGESTGQESLLLGIVSNGYLSRYGGSTTDLGTYFDAGWRSPWYDFGQASLNKRVLRITSLVDSTPVSQTLNVNVFKDWDEFVETTSLSIQLSADGVELVKEERASFTKSLRTFQFTISASSSAPTFSIHRFEVDWLPKGRTLV